jgi:hypothetical protein
MRLAGRTILIVDDDWEHATSVKRDPGFAGAVVDLALYVESGREISGYRPIDAAGKHEAQPLPSAAARTPIGSMLCVAVAEELRRLSETAPAWFGDHPIPCRG